MARQLREGGEREDIKYRRRGGKHYSLLFNGRVGGRI